MGNNMYDNITGRSPIATDDLGYIGTGQKASQILSNGTTDYDDLTNKPSINSVELSGNLSSSDLGLQPELTEAQTTAVNSGITAALTEQITTNQNNISLITPVVGNKIQYSLTGTDWQKIDDISIVVPAGKTAYFAVSATRSAENNLTGLAVVRGDTFSTDSTFSITENTAATDYFMLSTVGVRRNVGATDETLNIFVRFAGNASGTSVTYFMYVL